VNLLLQVAPLHGNSKALIVVAAAELVEYTSAEPLLFSLLTKTSKAPPPKVVCNASLPCAQTRVIPDKVFRDTGRVVMKRPMVAFLSQLHHQYARV